MDSTLVVHGDVVYTGRIVKAVQLDCTRNAYATPNVVVEGLFALVDAILILS